MRQRFLIGYERVGMGAAKKALDGKIFRDLIPINGLSPAYLGEIAQKAVVDEVRSGRYLFKRGDRDNQSVYLLEGEVSLIDEANQVVGTFRGGSDASRHPLANHQPRQVSARATSAALVVRIDTSLLDIMLTWDQSAGYEVVELDAEDDDDWMTRMLQSQAFLKLPPANIQRLLMSMEPFPVEAGDKIIEQGGDGDYFYLIKHGRCAVTRRPSANAEEVKVAELGDGASFGEDALLSDAKRNATVTMLTDGALMRLAKKDFVQLLKEPLIAQASYEQAKTMVAKGARWLDVRLPGEFENAALEDSVNIPLSSLRERVDELDLAERYIVCCDTGRRSASGAFVLSQRGYDVIVLRDGLMSVPEFAAAGSGEPAGGPAPSGQQRQAGKPAKKTGASPDRAGAGSPAQSPGPEVAGQGAAGGDPKTGYEKELAKFRLFQDKARERLRTAKEREAELMEARDLAEDQSRALSDELNKERLVLRRAEQALGDLRIQLEAARRESREQDEQATELENSLDALRNSESSARQELETLRARVAKLEGEQTQHRASAQELDELRGETARLRDELAGRASAAADAESSLEEARGALQRLQAERTDATERGAGLEVERDQLRTELAALRGELVAAQERATASEHERAGLAESLQAASADSGAERTRLQAELTAAQDRLRALEADRERLEQELRSAGESRAALDQLRAKQNDTERALEDAKSAASLKVQELQAELDAANLRLAERSEDDAQTQTALQQAMSTNQARIAELEAQQVSLAQERDTALRELAAEKEQAQARERTFGDQLADAQSELDMARSQLASSAAATEERDRLQEELQATRASLQALEQAQAASGQTVTEVSAELARLRTSEEEALARASQLQHELEQAQQRAADLAPAVEEAGREQDALRQELQRVRTAAEEEIGVVRGERDRASADAAEWGRRCKVQEERYEALQGEHAVVAEDKARLEQELAALGGQFDEQVARLQATDADLQERQSAREQSERALATAREELEQRSAEHARVLDDLREEFAGQQAELNAALAQAREALAQAVAPAEMERLVQEQEQQQAERDRLIEALRVELDDLRASSGRTKTELEEAGAARDELATQVADLQSRLDVLVREREAARTEADQLRAEAAVARGLAELRHGAASDDGDPSADLRKELEVAQRNVETALRLRTEAETAREAAEQEALQMQQELEMLRANGPAKPLDIPDLGESREQRVGAPSPGLAQKGEDAGVPVLTEQCVADGQGHAEQDAEVDAAAQATRKRRWRLWVGAAVTLVLSAGGATGSHLRAGGFAVATGPATVITAAPPGRQVGTV